MSNFDKPFWIVSVSKKRLVNSGAYRFTSSTILIFGILSANSKAARVNIRCCKFSVILNWKIFKIPEKPIAETKKRLTQDYVHSLFRKKS